MSETDGSSNTVGTNNADGQSGNANTGSNSDGSKNTESSKVVFSDAQQSKIQDLINGAHGKAFEKGRAESASIVDDLKAEVEALKNKDDTKSKKTDSGEDRIKEVVAEMDRKREEDAKKYQSTINSMQSTQVQNDLLMAITKHNVINPGDVAMLMRNDVSMADDGSLVIKGDNGAPMIDLDNGGAPMTLDSYVTKWLKDRPYLIRGSTSQGGGSSGSFGGGDTGVLDLSTVESVRNMPIEDLKKAMSNGGGISISGSQGQEYRFKDASNPFAEARKNKFKGAK